MSFRHAIDRLTGKAPKGAKRSPAWRNFRKKHINEVCELCGSKRGLELHHIIPFHKDPSRELDPTNVITLCDGFALWGLRSCHLWFGHLGDFTLENREVRKDVRYWRAKKDRAIIMASFLNK